jgi:hypothetical protein
MSQEKSPPDWQCLNCNSKEKLHGSVVIDIYKLPKSELQICVIRCPNCGDAQALRISGCVDSDNHGPFADDLSNVIITSSKCAHSHCNKDEMKISFDKKQWGFQIQGECIECGKFKDSRYIELVPFCGESIPPYSGRMGQNPRLKHLFDEIVERWRMGELPY